MIAVVTCAACARLDEINHVAGTDGWDAIPPVAVDGGIAPTGELESYAARVVEWTHNSRSAAGPIKSGEYRLAVKIVDGEIWMRFDPIGADGRTRQRSFVRTADAIVSFDPVTDQVFERSVLEDTEAGEGEIVRTLAPRLTADEFLAEYVDGSYRLAPESDNDILVVEAAPDYLADMSPDHASTTGATIYFDVSLGSIVAEVETVVYANGDRARITEIPLYEVADGVPVYVGHVTQTEMDVAQTIDTGDRTLPIIDDLSDIPTMSMEAIESLIADGVPVYSFGERIGDPADLDYVETTVVIYEEMTLNSVSDAVFRVAL